MQQPCSCPTAACGGNVVGSCTLIGSDLIVTARSIVTDANGDLYTANSFKHRVRFRRGSSGVENVYDTAQPGCGSDDYQEYWIAEYFEIARPAGEGGGYYDIVIARLACSPTGITPMPVELNFAPPFISPGIWPCVIAGWGLSGPCVGGGQPVNPPSGCAAPISPVSQVPSNSWRLRFGWYNGQSVGTTMDCGCPWDSGGLGKKWSNNHHVVAEFGDIGGAIIAERWCLQGSEYVSTLQLIGIITSAIPHTTYQHISIWNEYRTTNDPLLVDNGLACACSGDYNFDGMITGPDGFILQGYISSQNPRGDANKDGVINQIDYGDWLILQQNYHQEEQSCE